MARKPEVFVRELGPAEAQRLVKIRIEQQVSSSARGFGHPYPPRLARTCVSKRLVRLSVNLSVLDPR
jgi:hypothetical protein